MHQIAKTRRKNVIVLPIGILNESYQYVRDYIHSEAEIRGIFACTDTYILFNQA